MLKNGIDGVLNQVDQRLLEKVGIGEHSQIVRSDQARECNAPLRYGRGDQLIEPADNFRQLRRSHCRLRKIGDFPISFDKAHQSGAAPLDRINRRFDLLQAGCDRLHPA